MFTTKSGIFLENVIEDKILTIGPSTSTRFSKITDFTIYDTINPVKIFIGIKKNITVDHNTLFYVRERAKNNAIYISTIPEVDDNKNLFYTIDLELTDEYAPFILNMGSSTFDIENSKELENQYFKNIILGILAKYIKQTGYIENNPKFISFKEAYTIGKKLFNILIKFIPSIKLRKRLIINKNNYICLPVCCLSLNDRLLIYTPNTNFNDKFIIGIDKLATANPPTKLYNISTGDYSPIIINDFVLGSEISYQEGLFPDTMKAGLNKGSISDLRDILGEEGLRNPFEKINNQDINKRLDKLEKNFDNINGKVDAILDYIKGFNKI